ncbi:MAG: bifunctional metallophosphatase/5'-nucleotidase [Erysipelotrichaceae bacterium]|nr:bifunctional metallophosphatase/5'-nucleotidase [Erysipelotrichaceae bacterium]
MIRILMTSDVHACITPYSYATGKEEKIGLAKAAHLINRLRDENTIVIDNGDMLEGSPLSYYHFQKNRDRENPFSKLMNMTGYDFYNLGNHDFNFGEEVLFDHMDTLKMPCITANVLYRGKPLSEPYRILNVGGKKIALFGVMTHFVPNWEKEENIRDLEFLDAFEFTKNTVSQIREKENADYIVGVYHGGLEKDPLTGEETEVQTSENQGYRICSEIEGIDVLLCGHQHHPMEGKLNGTVFIQPAHEGRQIALVEIDDNGIVAKLLDTDDVADEDILSFINEEEQECQTWLDQPLGETMIDLNIVDEDDARLHKSQVITFLNRVCEDCSGADISGNALFLHARGFRKQITMRDLVSTYVFPNTLVVKKVTGKILKEYLEKCAEFWDVENGKIIVEKHHDFPTPLHFNYDMLDGVEYTIRVSNPAGQRITRLTRNGKDIKEDDEFTLCINNYRASGGGGFTMLKEAETVKEIQRNVVEIIADYITKVKVIDFEPVHNIEIEI